MGRIRTKSKRTIPTVTNAPASTPLTATTQVPSIQSLLSKAQELIVQCDYDLARKFIQRVLVRDGDGAAGASKTDRSQAREMLGVVLLELGEVDKARETFLALFPPHPDAPSIPPPSAHLYLAQLSEEDPHGALNHYQAAVEILQVQLKGKEPARNADRSADDDESEIRSNIVRAYAGMVEIWMDPTYDLCFDPSAEKTCENLLELALQADPGNPEALQTLASVRMSQERPDDAKACIEQAWLKWKDLELDDPLMPPLPSRLATAKLFLELSLFTPALLVLQGVLATDDQEVEAWYLEGWAFFLMAEQARETGQSIEGLSWEELAKDSRDCLESCRNLHMSQEHPDSQLLEHAMELIGNLDKLGIQPSLPGEAEEEDEGWEDDSEDGDRDGDVEMA
ncbi:hypothetical protein SERLA73DRAFT_182119 [Serpula lacrymans var. lacrymans S7.3]|uniref:TPR-like protein n=2 Tax=Serpula lacrymans var. lacrymans TaxID=341189 RepID=F8PZB5_SERL3|nr:uncharacterized protein SERLADRAFT_468628 [Serpula lacrymans var. lacrymans S7.9]EGN99228.1 hypothetical protein SERLA73DRAFT_182119 [Serpula lacrymans var. lacrymans S7.3]EGO24796.1 hypothetical protein SERLADRAFT_468628 [Serpula lacrymans var. lacrymans S7.9]